MAKIVSKAPINVDALNEIFQEIGAKEGFTMTTSDGNPVLVESDVKQEVLDWAVAQSKIRKTKQQLDEEARKALLAKTTWSNSDRDQALRILLERAVI